MTPDNDHQPRPDDLVEETVDLLGSFELTEYQARCFVALTRIETGTAKDVSEVADVPQARVYDCMDALGEHGLVDVQESTPRRFRAVRPEEAVGALERRTRRKLDRLGGLLPKLEAPDAGDGEGDVWVMEGDEEVSERLRSLVDQATEEVLFALPVEELLTDDLLSALADADDRGVDITLGSPAEAVRERVAEAAPGARVVEIWTWWDSHPIRPGEISSVLMVDGAALLASTETATSLPGVYRHRAVWTDSTEAPIVGLMRPILGGALEPAPA